MLLSFFDINTIAFTIAGYPMSYLELVGTLLNIACVWLVARNNIWSWPIGNIAVVLFGILFFQINLYSDFFEQIYFLVTGFYGWFVWSQAKKQKAGAEKTKEEVPRWGTSAEHGITVATIALGTLALGFFMSHIHTIFPNAFAEPASFPYLDAFTTIMSFVANILLVHRRISSWPIWILVDIIGIWLYFQKGVLFVSLLYVLFLGMAISGLWNWIRLNKKQEIV